MPVLLASFLLSTRLVNCANSDGFVTSIPYSFLILLAFFKNIFLLNLSSSSDEEPSKGTLMPAPNKKSAVRSILRSRTISLFLSRVTCPVRAVFSKPVRLFPNRYRTVPGLLLSPFDTPARIRLPSAR